MAKVTVIAHNPELRELVDVRANIVYAQPDGETLAMHMARPRWSSGGKGFPLVVFIQGSGWTKPDQFWEMAHLSQLALRGYVVASVTHRSCMTAGGSAFLQDVKSALRFLRAHAAEYDIDKERVCAWGTSSGGNTALLLGLTADDPRFESDVCAGESTHVDAVVDCFGPTDLCGMAYRSDASPVCSRTDRWHALANSTDEDECRKGLEMLSPITYAQPGKDYPPFLLLHGDADPVVLYEDTEAFFDCMNACGYDMELVRVTDAPHEGNFWSMQLLTIIFDFIEKHIG